MDLKFNIPDDADPVALLGSAEKNLKLLRETLGVTIHARDRSVQLSGAEHSVRQAAAVLEDLAHAAQRNRTLSRQDVLERIRQERTRDEIAESQGVSRDGLPSLNVYAHGRRIEPQTPGQAHYLDAILRHDLVFCSGPAGTGKTYLAVAAAVSLLKSGAVRKLVLARPAVEAGEKLGFLPGDLQQKVNPYLRPLLDGLHDMMSFEQAQRFMQHDVIEIVPLAFMRGRTLNDAIIILDEAQNATRSQMLMFLTRLGTQSKMIVTGDTSQVDLEDGRESGLIDAARRLRQVPGVAFVTLGRRDIVRHSLVQAVVEAYGGENASE